MFVRREALVVFAGPSSTLGIHPIYFVLPADGSDGDGDGDAACEGVDIVECCALKISFPSVGSLFLSRPLLWSK